MGALAIRAVDLTKQYKIGRAVQRSVHRYRTLREAVTDGVVSRFRARRERRTTEEAFLALRDVSFDVKAGEILGIIGRNGAGKSTLLKILSRITEPTAGFAEVRGRVSTLLEVGTGFHPELTGRENIYLSGAVLGMRKGEIQARFDEIVAFAEVERFIDTPVKHYSSGMYLRLGFAVAAHLEPEILLVDEVLAVGDAGFQRKCLGKMGTVAREGRTVLFVSHNMGAISNLCRSTLWLEGGRLVDVGDPESVISAYIARTTADVPDQGYADVEGRERHEKFTSRRGWIAWVRTLDGEGQQRATFREGEPLCIEVGIRVKQTLRNLQMGCVVSQLHPGVELFTIPSREYPGELEAGSYSILLKLDPNYLREGSYTLALKMFADGVRQDTILDTLRMDILGYLAAEDDRAHFTRWVSGPLRLPYQWGDIRSNLEVLK